MTRSFLRTVAALAGALMALALATSAWAGGWSVVTLDSESASALAAPLRPGEPLEIGFRVLQHGDKPVSGLSPLITLTPRSGPAVTVSARPEGAPGHYVATITLPTAGDWRWEIEAFGPPSPMAPLTVAAAPAPAAPAPALAPAILIVAAALAAALSLGLLALRLRRPVAVS